MSNATHTVTMTDPNRTASDARHTSRLATFFAALFGATCACTAAGCDDPTDPEALADLARDEAAEDLPPQWTPDVPLDIAVPSTHAEGFAAVTGVTSTCMPTPTCTVPSNDWCSAYGKLADAAGVPKLYRDIMVGKCAKNLNSSCYECWDLANYCSQVGTSCANLQAKCNCVAQKLGA